MRIKIIWNILLICLLFGNAEAQVNTFVQPLFKKYTSDDYNLGPQNWGMVQLKNGNILVANNEGMLEFDGTTFRKHVLPSSAALSDMALISDDTLVVCGQDEFGYFVITPTGEFKYYSLAEKVKKRNPDIRLLEFRNLFVTRHGVYFTSFDKFYKMKGDDAELVYSIPADKKTYLVFGVGDNMYFNVDKRNLIRFSGDRIDTIYVGDNYPLNTRGMVETNEGKLIIFCTNGVYELDGADKKTSKIKKCEKIKVPEMGISYAIQLSDKIVMVSEHEMYYLDKNDFHITRIISDELYNGKIARIIQDNAKNEWLMQDNGFGVVFSSLPVEQSLPSLPIDGLIYDIEFDDNIIWVSNTHNLLKLEYDTIKERFEKPVDMSVMNDQYFEVQKIEFKNGTRKYSTSSKGLFEIGEDNKTLKQLTKIPCTQLFDQGKDYDWVLLANINYVAVYRKDHINRKLVDPMPISGVSDQIRYVASDKDNVLWLGTVYDGAYMLIADGKTFPVKFNVKFYNQDNGLTDSETFMDNVDGKVLIAQLYGLAEYNQEGKGKNQFRLSGKYNKIFTENKMSVFQYAYNKQNDQLIMITYGDRGDLVEGIIKDKNEYKLVTDLFKILPARQLYNVNADKDGNFWLGGERVVYRISAGFEKYNTGKKYHTNLRQVTINPDSVVFNGNNIESKTTAADIVFDKLKEINFEFSTPVFLMQEKVQYSYYLEGYEDTWSHWTKDTKKSYTNLSHGNYVFRVRARDVFGNISEIDTYSFTVATPWYFMWWAYMVYFLMLIGVVVASVKVYSYKLQHENKMLEEKISQRTKEVVEQKNEIEHQKQAIEIINKNITDSIIYAQKIQNALLPNEEVFQSIFPLSFILFKPKDIVSGDYYWISDRERYIFYATADCTGHGVPGGFMSMLGTALLNEIVDERKVEDCGEVLTLMREKIMQALKQAGDSESKDGMDMVLIRIDKNTLEMQYAAANNSFYIVSRQETQDMRQEISNLKSQDSSLHEMQCDKMPVGVYHSEVKPFQTFTHQLQKGDTIYTYTDGYADQFGGDLSTGSRVKKYTYKRLREKLVAISQEPLVKQKDILESEFENWKGEQEQIDDVCLIGIKV